MVLAHTSGTAPNPRRGRPHTLRDRPPATRARTILVVDDDPDLLASLRQLLESQPDGFRVLTARTAHRALELLDTEPIDLILADYRMAPMNGLEFLHAARARAPHVPRCLMTAYPDLQVALDAVNETGTRNVFQKPFHPDVLVAELRHALEGIEAARDGVA